ncbi:hypothetical protein OU798_23505 [Prolixibacteraceae bacterium Z1-6]|uniref:V-type ATP synthase subunit E n=1 Tax=Draconibacterium aestuarii TaxID=2998507 RepID=A0A9X3FBI9_9BACT|nr:hypothetical protein [Prolixibacteraceae bacterium Z1-6]
MKENKENLQGIVSKLKSQGINAGEEEKQRIISEAKKQAADIVKKAKAESETIIKDAESSAAQIEKNAQAAIVQASRDMVEATKITILKHLKSVFGKQTETLFSEKQYLQEIVKAVVESIDGKKTLSIKADTVKDMEAFLQKQALADKVELKILEENEAKIVVSSSEKEGVQFVLSAKDVEDGLFSLLNKDLVKRITQNSEE